MKTKEEILRGETEEAKEYWATHRKELIAFLKRAIRLNKPIMCSLQGRKEMSKEVVLKLANGYSLRSGGYDYQAGAYVRLCNALGVEMLYWDKEEWQTDPELVMGAILLAASNKGKLKKAVKLRQEYLNSNLVVNKMTIIRK